MAVVWSYGQRPNIARDGEQERTMSCVGFPNFSERVFTLRETLKKSTASQLHASHPGRQRSAKDLGDVPSI